jgi:small redox-active disulfide protein 2
VQLRLATGVVRSGERKCRKARPVPEATVRDLDHIATPPSAKTFHVGSRAVCAARSAPVEEISMKEVQVLGTGCANCRTTVRMIEEVAQERGVDIELQKVERIEDIAAAGVMRTPGVIVDGRIVHAGGIPTREAIAQWLKAA